MIKRTLSYFSFLLLLVLSNISADSNSNAVQSVPSGFNAGPDIVAGNMADLEQFGAVGTQRGLATGLTSCNAGNQLVGYFAIPGTDHPAVAQNLYRMSGGPGNDDRFEQIGQSWVKHTFGEQANGCSFGCQPGGDFTHLGVGCSDTYFSSQSAVQGDLGSRAWINPFTGIFPSNARDHTGHNHSAVSHMMTVETNDLNTTMNPGATYYAELVYVTPDEYAWCQTHPGECNMSNNASYLQYGVNGTTNFTFSQIGSPVRFVPAISAWPGATVKTIEPAPGVDGQAFLAYKVTGPVGGLYHYEYAIYNLNLDRGIQSFSVPRLLIPSAGEGPAQEQNVGFHGPPQQPGFPNDGTQGDMGFSGAEWTYTAGGFSLTWNTETFAQNQNANAIRWGTLYNFRFDSPSQPVTANATIGFFKTGAPITVEVQGPAPIGGPSPTPPPTPTPTPPPCPGCTPTPTPTGTPTPTATPTPTDPPCVSVLYSENFDGVTPPALPPGWGTSAAAGPANCTPSGVCSEGGFWATNSDLPHMGPNAAYHNAPGCVTDSVLDLPVTFTANGPFELQFWQSYDLDANLDGAVLEVSIDGGNFMDVIDAGGTFTRGGYNGTISTGFLSPIAGRQAWTGASGYSPTGVLINISTAKAVFRFRLATDCSGSGEGWRIDTLRVIVSNCTPTPSPTPTPTPAPTPSPGRAMNLSTRMLVQADDGVAIGGFIITGTGPKEVVLRGIGPSLASLGVPNALADPVLELHGPPGFKTRVNDNWMDWCRAGGCCPPPRPPSMNGSEFCPPPGPGAPSSDLESLIYITLDPGAYTVILRGNGNPVGVGLVEIYDVSQSASSRLANLSTRAFVGTGDDIVIAGFILGNGSGDDQVVVRGLGPSLGAAGLSSVLVNPTLDLRDSNGVSIATNNDWQDDPVQAAILTKLGLAPTNSLESGLVAMLQPGPYTALLSGANNGTGLGLVEVYANPAGPTATPGGGGTPTPTPGGATPTPTPNSTPGTCVENFDGVTAPALPTGWVASNPVPGDGVLWMTSNVTPDSAPNDAFIPDQDGISDKVLDRPGVMVQSSSAMLTFRNNFNTEFSGGVYWDGGVLEISTPSISNGDFLDFTDARVGGVALAGGYTGELPPPPGPITGGRMAWSGNSGGYINTVINLGPNLAGQTITLRWRFISDEAAAAPGWRIDTLSITGASCQ